MVGNSLKICSRTLHKDQIICYTSLQCPLCAAILELEQLKEKYKLELSQRCVECRKKSK